MNRKKSKLWNMLLSITIVFSLLLGMGSNPIPGKAEESVPEVSAPEVSAPKISLQEVTAENELGNITLKQTEINKTGVTVRISESVLTEQQADSVKITAKMYYKDTVTRDVTETFSLKSDKEEYTVDFKDFGKYTVETEYLKGNDTIAKSTAVTLGIIAEEYNIAVLSATFPVSLFSLSLWGDKADGCITQGEWGNDIPTFAVFNRTGSWNWSSLPKNVYKLPLASDSDYDGFINDWNKARTLMTAYVKDLYEISPQAFFHLYTGDNYVEHLMMFFIANQIPEDQYDMVLLSDGVGTYSIFNKTFQNDDGTKYQEMLEEWKSLKERTREAKRFDSTWAKYGNAGYYQCLENYAAVAAADENVEWWMARPANFSIQNTDLMAEVKENCITKSLATMLTKVESLGKSEDFKSLYHFDNDMFTEANENGKPVMVILGTTVTSEKNFKDYAKIVMEYYGDSYEYYYKGHPGTPTALYPSKQKELDELGITDVDSMIPAEFIMFFFPDIYLCGYSTTTFVSVEAPEMACSLFGWTKENAKKDANVGSYSEMMDFFISPLDANNTAYGQYCTEEGHVYYLLEYNDTSVCDISVYDATVGEFKHYKLSEETPSPAPSGTPSAAPSGTPSAAPSGTPSVAPSGTPSVAPSGTPSTTPSGTPSTTPSGTPSAAPSGTPSTAPSVAPSGTPSTAPSGTPSTAPSGTPSTAPSGTPSAAPSGTPSATKSPSATESVVAKAKYKITDSNKKTVTYIASTDAKTSSIVVPAEVKINGIKYKVTAIAKNAFSKNTKLKKIVIGKNIKTIGKNAFYKCKKLSNITIKTKYLTTKSVGANAFKGLSPKVKIKVPAKKLAAYKKILKKRGVTGKKQKIKK